MDAIPFRRDPVASRRESRSDAQATPSVLVVDDSRFVRASLVRGLASRFRLQQAESGERAWELLLLDASIGAVLSDLSMPGMDGFELLRRVRGSMLERVRTLPFAVLSGADDPAQRAKARDLGADRFVVKGDGVEALADWIAERLAAAVSDASGASVVGPAPSHAGEASVGAPSEPAASSVSPERVPTAPASPAGSALPTGPVPSAEPMPSHAFVPATVSEPIAASEVTAPTARTAPTPESAPTPATPAALARGGAGAPPVPASAVDVVARSGESVFVPPHAAADTPPPLVPDPLDRWFRAAVARPSQPGDAPPALLRLHAPGLDDLPARLRRGVRSADALHLDGDGTAWLCVPAAGPLALRLAIRFGVLAAGRLAIASGPAARVSVCLLGVDPARPADALAAMRALPPEGPDGPGLAIRALAGPWGPAWRCTLPWPAARLLVSA